MIKKRNLEDSLQTWIKGQGSPFSGTRKGKDVYVDSTNGSDNWDGESWDDPVASIGQALTIIGTQKFCRIFVAPGDYVITEAIAVTAEGTQIIGAGDDNRNVSLVYTSESDINLLTIDAHHVEIIGMSFGPVPDGYKAVVISGTSASYKVRIAHCRFDGWSGEYGIYINESPDVVIEDCLFRSWNTAAIYANSTRAMIRRNTFHLVAGKIGIEHIPDGGGRPDTVIQSNVIKGVNSTDTGIKITNTPNENALVVEDNRIVNCATPITAQRYTSWYDDNYFGADNAQYHSSIDERGGRVFYCDANAGTTGLDGRSWKSAFLTLTEAVAVATTRFDTIIMRAGDYDEGAAVAITTQGLTIKGENNDHQNRAMIWSTSGTYNLMEIDAHEVTIDGISFSVIPDTKSAIVISGTSASYKCTIRNCRLDGWSGEYGVYLNESPDTLIEDCVFRSFNTAAIYSNSTRTMIRRNIFHVVDAKIGIEHVPSGGGRPDNVYVDNLFSGATDTTTTAIQFTGAPSDGTIIVARNLLCGTFDVDITKIAAHGGVENYAADGDGGALIDTVT
jgi:hypothetical protein